MRRRAILLGIALLSLASLGAAAWFGPALALTRAQSAASRAIGRPVRIGALHLLPTWPPTMLADRVSAAGLGTVARVRASLDAGALWNARIRVASVRLIGPDLAISTDASGLVDARPAPRPRPADAEAVHVGAASTAPASAPDAAPDLSIEDAHVVWRDPRFGGAVVLDGGGRFANEAGSFAFSVRPPPALAARGLADLRIAAGGAPHRSVHVEVGGTFRAYPFTADLSGPPLDQLRAHQPVAIDLTARVADTTLVARGSLDDLAHPGAFTGHARLEAEDEARWSALLGIAALPDGPVAADAALRLDRGTLAWQGLSLRSPQADLMGEGALRFTATPDFRGRLDIARLDLDRLPEWRLPRGAPAAAGPRAGPAAQPAAPPPPAEPRLIPDVLLPWSLLNGATGSLRLRVARLVWRAAGYTDLAAEIRLAGAILDAGAVALNLPGGAPVRGSVRLDDWADPPAAHVVLRVASAQIAPLLQALRQPPVVEGEAALNLDLRGAGASLRALAASLDGTASLHVGVGALQNRLFDILFAATGLPLPRLKGATRLRCLDLAMRALAGTADFSSLVIDTDRLRIDGDGALNLADESLNFSLHPLWRGGFGFSVPMDVGGTLARPTLGMGGMLAALLPPPSLACPDLPPGAAVPAGALTPPAAPAPAGAVAPAPPRPPKLPRLKDLLRQLR